MIMMQRIKYVRHLVVVIVGIMGVLLAHIAWRQCFGVKKYMYAIDSLFALPIRCSMLRFLQERSHALQPADLYKELSEQFPAIKSLSAELIAPGVLYVQVQATKPLIMINDDFVMTDSGLICVKTLFCSERLRSLYSMHIASGVTSNDYASSALRSYIEHLDPALHTKYSMTWHNDYEIWLRDKQQPSFAILCTAATLGSARLLHYGEQCRKEMTLLGTASQKAQGTLIADIRFDKQIIMYREKKGWAHG